MLVVQLEARWSFCDYHSDQYCLDNRSGLFAVDRNPYFNTYAMLAQLVHPDESYQYLIYQEEINHSLVVALTLMVIGDWHLDSDQLVTLCE